MGSKKEKAGSVKGGAKPRAAGPQARWWPGAKGWAWLAAVVVITAACYVEIPRAEFMLYDDGTFVVNNPTLRTMTPVSKFFVDPKAYSVTGKFAIYRAIPAMSFAVDYQIGYALDRIENRPNPTGKPYPAVFHVTNVVLHLVDTGLVYVLLLILIGNPMAAAVGALIFGVHPVNIESVSWVTRRGNGFAVMFMLIGLILHARLRQGVGHKTWKYVGVVACYVLGLLSQEMGIILAGLLLAYDLTLAPRAERHMKELAIYYLPMVAVAGLYFLLRHAVLGTIAQQGYYDNSIYVTMLTMTKVFATYLRQLFVPMNLSVCYAVPLSRSLLEWPVLGSLGILAAFAASGAMLWRRAPLYSLCVAWFFITLAPVSNLVPLQSLQNDRFMYMTTVGLGLGLAGLLARGLKRDAERSEWGFGLAAGVLLWGAVATAGALTFAHNRVWLDDFSLWQAAREVQPDSYFVRTNMGKCYYERGEMDGAIKEWKAAIKLSDRAYVAANNLSVAYAAKGDLAEAEKVARLALEWEPNEYMTRMQLADVLERQGRYPEAAAQYRETLKGEAHVPQERYQAHFSLARLLLARGGRGALNEAVQHAQEAYRLHPDANTGLLLVHTWRLCGNVEGAKKLAEAWSKINSARQEDFKREVSVMGGATNP